MITPETVAFDAQFKNFFVASERHVSFLRFSIFFV